MRRLALVLVVAVAGVLALGVPLAAAPDASLNREVTGPFSGTQSIDNTRACFIPSFPLGTPQTFDATYQPDRPGSGSIRIDACVVSEVPSVSLVVGTFNLTSRAGATLTGTVGGLINFLGQFGPPIATLHFRLTVTEGTRRLQHVTGTIAFDGIWHIPEPPGNTISGTLTGSLQR
jgi:hypothetical protein